MAKAGDWNRERTMNNKKEMECLLHHILPVFNQSDVVNITERAKEAALFMVFAEMLSCWSYEYVIIYSRGGKRQNTKK